jgi:MFS family permease
MTEAGIIYAVYFAFYTLFSPVLGMLGDRFNNRILLTVFTAVLALGALFMSLAETVTMACVYFALAGLGTAACWVPVVALVQRWVPENRKGIALSIATMGVGIGVPLWSFLLPHIVARFGWQAGWISLGLFGLAVAGVNGFLVRNPPQRRDGLEQQPAEPLRQSCGALLRDKTFWLIGMSYLFVGANEPIPFAFISIYTRDVLDFPYSVATRFIAVITFVGLAGQLVLGALSDRWGRIRVIIICGILMGTSYVGMAHFKSQWGLYGAAAVYGLGFGAIWPMYGAAGSDFFRKDLTGSVFGLWTLFLGVGSVVSPIICGRMIDTTGNYTGVFLLGGCCMAISVLLLVPLLKKGR